MAVPPPNVKVYDRPESKAKSPLVIVIALLIVAIIGFFIYRDMHHDVPAPEDNARPGIILMQSVTRADAFYARQGQIPVFANRGPQYL